MSATEGSAASGGPGFTLEFHGRQVEVVLPVLEAGAVAPGAAAILSALRSSPLKSVDRAALERALEVQLSASEPVRVLVGEAPLPPVVGGPCAIVLSSDRLAAYAVPLPPDPVEPDKLRDGAAEDPTAAGAPDAPDTPDAPSNVVTAVQLRTLLDLAGVTSGRLDEVLAAFAEGVPLVDVVCVARGSRATPGVDATLEYHIATESNAAPPVEREDGSVDHHATQAQRFVKERALLVTKHPLEQGVPGFDVTGKATAPASPKDLDLTRLAGKNTVVEGDTLLSTIAGRPARAPSGAIDILPVFEVPGDVDYSVGNIDFPGEVIVRGDVKSGFAITARGSVTVRGLVESASITAGGDLTLTGVVGEHETFLQVGGNLVASYLHTTEAHVTGTVTVSGEIMNSTIIAERVHTSAKGRIVGGQITAQTEIDCGALGSREGRATRVHVATQEPTSVVRARRTIYPGVVVQLGRARREITDELPSASFWDAAGAIVSLRADIDPSEAAVLTAPAEAEEPPAEAAA